VTTRERDLNLGFESLPLDVLSKEKSLALLRKIVGAVKVDRELAIVEQVCETLGYLPLAIELVGEYLVKNRHLTFAKLQENLRLADKVLSSDRKNKFYAYRGVESAILLSWQDLSAASQRVAMCLGLFAPVEIGWKLVADMAASAEITESELDEARGELDRLHLIQPVGEDCNFYKIHTLVREFFRDRLAQATENQLFRGAFVKSLLDVAKRIPQSPTRDLIATVAPAIPHLDMLSREMLGDIPNPEEDNNLFYAFLGISRFFKGQGLYELAEDPLQRSLKAIKELLGERNLSIAASISNLGELYKLQGRYAEAEPFCIQALVLSQELLGKHYLVAANINNLGTLYKSQGRYVEAEPLLKQALTLSKELLGENHSDVATIISNLAGLYCLQGRYAEAEPLFIQALVLSQELLGEDDLSVAISINNLAGLYKSQGRYAEAEPLLKQALAMKQELLEESHPSVATSINNLAELYYLQGKYDEAEPLLKQTLTMRRELLGESHPDVAASINNLGWLYKLQGKYDEAESLLKQALALMQELLGVFHPDVATNLSNLALLYQDMRRYSEALKLIQQTIQIYKPTLGLDHPNTKAAERCLLIIKGKRKKKKGGFGVSYR
jgi:tetratricopeptide (TPR) repeat protein